MNFYYPRTTTDAPDDKVLESWGADYGITTEEIQNLSARERSDALEALYSLSVGMTQKVEPDINDPYRRLRDDDFRDAMEDSETLAKIARHVLDRRPQFPAIPEDTWRYFEQFPDGADESEYKLVHVDVLFRTKPPRGEQGHPTSVMKAYTYMDNLARGEDGAKKRDPLSVRDNGDGTYSVIDGNATLEVAKRQGWKELPVRVRPVIQLPSGGLWRK